MKKPNHLPRLMALAIMVCASGLFAGTGETADFRDVLIQDVCEKLEKFYTYPDVAARTIRAIREKLKKGGYAAQTDPDGFLEALNEDLYQASRDRHLKLLRDPRQAKELREGGSEESLSSVVENDRWRNFGFRRLEVLGGLVGYLSLSDFSPVAYAGENAVKAMSYLSECRALIIDLRQNGGGSDDMVMFLASYFVEADDPVVVKILYSTIDQTYYSSETLPFVPGKKFADRPVYILTSPATASAAEAFISTLLLLHKDVTLVGQRTRGAENPVNHLAVGEDYVLRLPSWRTIYSANPIAWEGTGIAPQIETSSDQALPRAHLEAVRKLAGRSRDESERVRFQWAEDGIRPFLEPVSVGEEVLKSYEGLYGTFEVKLENGFLHFGPNKLRLIPISERYFLVETADHFRLRFLVEGGRVIGLERIFVYGYSTRLSRKERDRRPALPLDGLPPGFAAQCASI